MIHKMKLRQAPFEAIESGNKRYELRLSDEKRAALRVGDTVCFTCEDGRKICAEVISLQTFADFIRLFESILPAACGFAENMTAAAAAAAMNTYYPPEKQARYAALAIEIKVIKREPRIALLPFYVLYWPGTQGVVPCVLCTYYTTVYTIKWIKT